MDGMVVDNHYIRTPSRMYPEMEEMDAAFLNEKARALGLPFSGWRPAFHAGLSGSSDAANQLVGMSPTSLPNIPLSTLQQLYAMNNNRPFSNPSNFPLPVPSNLWSQWTLGLGLNQLGLFGLGFGLNAAAGTQLPGANNPATAATSAAAPVVNDSPLNRAKSSQPQANYRFNPYPTNQRNDSSTSDHSPT